MVFTAVHVAILAAVFDRHVDLPGPVGQRALVAKDVGKRRALQAADCARKTDLYHFVGQADDFEQLRPAIGVDGRDPHLGEDLEQALADAAPVVSAQLHCFIVGVFDLAAGRHGMQGLIDQVGVDRGCAEADQAGDLVGIAGCAGLDDEIALQRACRIRAGGDELRRWPAAHGPAKWPFLR